MQRFLQHRRFKALVRQRLRLAWGLALIMAVVYFGFIALVGFRPALLAHPVGPGPVTLGLWLAAGVVVVALMLTGIYVWRANHVFDAEARRLRQDLE